MNKYFEKKLKDLENEINLLQIETSSPLQRIEIAISAIIMCLTELKNYVIENNFKDNNEEIYFFKQLKPNIVSKLIYYNSIYKIEKRKPYGQKPTRKYLKKELKKLKNFFNNNLDFYKYYRNNSSFLDKNLFIRNNHDLKLCLDTYYFQCDFTFSTSHDYKVAKIMANDLIQVYIKNQLNNNIPRKQLNGLELNWTASKTALTELIYALHSQGVFENGNVDIRLIAKKFENIFNIDLGDFYHTFMEIKSRKINRTKFLDNLKDGIVRKMDEDDERIN